jgi:hypothetical protein
VAVCERNDDSVGGKAFEPVHRVGGEARLALLTVRNDRRPGLLEAGDRVPDGLRVERIELFRRDALFRRRLDGVDELGRPRDAADRLGRNPHGPTVAHAATGVKASREQISLGAPNATSG